MFPLLSNASTDAAVFNSAFPVRDYTVVGSGVGGATGLALAGIYDAAPAGTFTPSSPRLINVSFSNRLWRAAASRSAS
jgi:hypothetical protein